MPSGFEITRPQLIACAIVALLVFWIVGAYNRLTRLRAAMLRRFAPVEEQLRTRQVLLLRWLDALEPRLANAAPRIDALRAACVQVEAAWTHARGRPAEPEAIASLRLADEILADARGRLPVPSAPGSELASLATQLQAVDATFAFARGQFDDAVRSYNRAVRQFPTVLLVRLFGFRRAGSL